jgi:hypothetical protein
MLATTPLVGRWRVAPRKMAFCRPVCLKAVAHGIGCSQSVLKRRKEKKKKRTMKLVIHFVFLFCIFFLYIARCNLVQITASGEFVERRPRLGLPKLNTADIANVVNSTASTSTSTSNETICIWAKP